jgi:hypothetical protein
MPVWEGSYGRLIRHAEGAVGYAWMRGLALAFRPRGALLFPLRVGPLQQILGARTA